MAVEARRGCGYRKAGGTYLVGGGIGMPCDRLPFELSVCPCCSEGIKPSLGWTWIRPGLLFQGPHRMFPCADPQKDPILAATLCLDAEDDHCWLCEDPGKFEKAGLIWIGERFYKDPNQFMAEGHSQGFSRRIKAVPRGFKAGETPIFLAHKKAVPKLKDMDEPLAKGGVEKILVPGIFYVWIPQRIEKIFNESERGSESVRDAEKRGIVPIFVPDNDPDHHGSVYDKEEE